jgi:hypothetical protein
MYDDPAGFVVLFVSSRPSFCFPIIRSASHSGDPPQKGRVGIQPTDGGETHGIQQTLLRIPKWRHRARTRRLAPGAGVYVRYRYPVSALTSACAYYMLATGRRDYDVRTRRGAGIIRRPSSRSTRGT